MTSDTENNHLSWAQNPSQALLRLSWPIAVSMLSYAVMTLVDTLFVSRLGAPALAGVGLGATAAFALLCFPFGMLRGAKVLVSQARGAGDHSEIGSYLGAALVVGGALGLIILGIGLALPESLADLTATAAAGAEAATYFSVRILSAPALLVYVALREVRYGVGDARSPMLAALVGNILNVVLDYLLIFEAELGVEGAAWSTTVAHTSEALILIAAQVRHGFAVRNTRLAHIGALWRLGFPTGLQFVLEMGSFAVLAALLSKLGELDMGAHVIALQLIHFSFLPSVALSEAASVLVGEAVGARREELVLRVARLSMLVATTYGGVCAAVLVIARHQLVAAFTDDVELASVAALLLLVAAAFQVFDAANIIARGVLRGVGDVRFPAVVGITIAWVCTPPLTWLLGYKLGWGAVGGWIGLCLEIIVGAVILWLRVQRGSWRRAAARTRADRERVARRAGARSPACAQSL